MQLGVVVISNCRYTCLCVRAILAQYPGPNKASAILTLDSYCLKIAFILFSLSSCLSAGIFEGGDHSRVVYDQYVNPQLVNVCHSSMQRLAVW